MTNGELDNKFKNLEKKINDINKLNDKLERINMDLEILSKSGKEE